MVGIAVDFKPVSSPRFPGNWEKNWEFPLIPAIDLFVSPEDLVVTMACGEIPKAMELGIFERKPGKKRCELGILNAAWEIREARLRLQQPSLRQQSLDVPGPYSGLAINGNAKFQDR